MSAGMPASSALDGFLRDPVLAAVPHGFGRRGCVAPPGWWAPRQVHGSAVWLRTGTPSAEPASRSESGAHSDGDPVERPAADAVVSDRRGACIGIATADCLPVLLASDDAGLVAAAHAGWRGLAAGVLAESVAAMARCGAQPARLRAAIGPHIGPCCYEIDAPVVDALAARFGRPVFGADPGGATGEQGGAAESALERARRTSRPGHWHLDLGALARADLEAAGVLVDRIGTRTARCTFCGRGADEASRRDNASGRPGAHPSRGRGRDPDRERRSRDRQRRDRQRGSHPAEARADVRTAARTEPHTAPDGGPSFESYRRDGAAAGRLIHFIVAGAHPGSPARVGLDTRRRRV